MSNNFYQPPAQQPHQYAVPTNRGLMWLLFSFEGRIGRAQYWLGSLGAGMAIVVLMVLLMVTLGPEVGQILALLLYIPMLWISAAVTVKRWHDRGKSGVYYFVQFIPLIGGLWTLIECGFLEGDFGGNQYGPPAT